jgi:hypothetical protein
MIEKTPLVITGEETIEKASPVLVQVKPVEQTSLLATPRSVAPL